MFFDQAIGAPVTIDLDGERVAIPKMTMDDWATLGTEDLAEREDRLTKGMNVETRFRFLSFYQTVPLDGAVLRQLAYTPNGQRKIIRICCDGAAVVARRGDDGVYVPLDKPEPVPTTKGVNRVAQKLFKAHWKDQERLAIMLADMQDRQQMLRQQQEQQNTPEGDTFGDKGGERPLTGGGNPESSA